MFWNNKKAIIGDWNGMWHLNVACTQWTGYSPFSFKCQFIIGSWEFIVLFLFFFNFICGFKSVSYFNAQYYQLAHCLSACYVELMLMSTMRIQFNLHVLKIIHIYFICIVNLKQTILFTGDPFNSTDCNKMYVWFAKGLYCCSQQATKIVFAIELHYSDWIGRIKLLILFATQKITPHIKVA